MTRSYRELSDTKSVIKAVDEYDRIGRDAFLKKYKFGKAKNYYLLYRGAHYDSKAIVGAACGFQFGKPLTSNDFSGGKNTVRPKLESMGFRVVSMLIDDKSAALPEEVPDSFPEGARRQVSINAFERNPDARVACIEHHGSQCVVCKFDFGSVYGEEFAGFIHVHHTIPLSKMKRSYLVNPQKDMLPVCPNCHAVIHHGGKNRSIEQLRKLLIAGEYN